MRICRVDFIAATLERGYGEEMGIGTSMWWSAGSWIAAGVFGLSCLAQFNDPDPLGWAFLYGSAAVLAGVGSRRRVSRLAGLVLGVCVLWLLWLAVGGLPEEPRPMKYGPQAGWLADEVVREGGGLVLVALWMGVLVTGKPSSTTE